MVPALTATAIDRVKGILREKGPMYPKDLLDILKSDLPMDDIQEALWQLSQDYLLRVTVERKLSLETVEPK